MPHRSDLAYATNRGLVRPGCHGCRLFLLDPHSGRFESAVERQRSETSVRKPFLAADLIRNNIFYRADDRKENPEKLFKIYWKPFEAAFWSEVSSDKCRFC
jgi:hypothetical protein